MLRCVVLNFAAMASHSAEQEAPQWEQKKENVAPVRKGIRDVAALNVELQTREGLMGLKRNESEAKKEERR